MPETVNLTPVLVAPVGEVLANLDDRTITGLLLPFGEVGMTNAGPIIVEAEHVELPGDPITCSINTDHKGARANVGIAAHLWKEAQGVMATFTFAKTDAGDAALSDALDPNGKRRALSGEFDVVLGEFDPVSKARRSLPGGRLWGAALVERGAFPSAVVLAEDRSSASKYVTEYTDEEGATWRRVEETTTTTTETETGHETTSVTTVTETTEGTPEEEEATVPEQETVMAGAVPGTIVENGATAVTASRAPSIQTIAQAIADLKANRNDQQAVEVLAALSDLTFTDAGGAIQPNWMGLVSGGVPYVQEYITLFNPGTEIYAGGKKGYKLRRGTEGAPVDAPHDGTWAGNKTAIKSYKGFTTDHTSVLDRWAIGEDIGREFYDLPGGMDFVLAFLQFLQEDYLIWQDELALEYAIATAGAPVAPATADYPAVYPAALGHLIQGILAVKKRKTDGRRDTPTFAIMNDLDFTELIYAAGGEQNLPAFVSIALSTASNGTVDGNVQVVNGDVGIEDTGATLVGASYAIDFDRPAGGLLEVDALDIARGGVDKAVHGYLQTFVKRPEALVLVGTVDV